MAEQDNDRPWTSTVHQVQETRYCWLTEVIEDERTGELWPQFTSPCATPEAAMAHGRTLAAPLTGQHWTLVEVVKETVTRVRWRAV